MKNLLTIVLLVLLVLFITSCVKQKENINFEYRKYQILSLKPPKHVFVDLQDIETGKIFHNVYVSKHLNNYNNIQIGLVIILKRYYEEYEGYEKYYFESHEIYSLLSTI